MGMMHLWYYQFMCWLGRVRATFRWFFIARQLRALIAEYGSFDKIPRTLVPKELLPDELDPSMLQVQTLIDALKELCSVIQREPSITSVGSLISRGMVGALEHPSELELWREMLASESPRRIIFEEMQAQGDILPRFLQYRFTREEPKQKLEDWLNGVTDEIFSPEPAISGEFIAAGESTESKSSVGEMMDSVEPRQRSRQFVRSFSHGEAFMGGNTGPGCFEFRDPTKQNSKE